MSLYHKQPGKATQKDYSFPAGGLHLTEERKNAILKKIGNGGRNMGVLYALLAALAVLVAVLVFNTALAASKSRKLEGQHPAFSEE
jgi:hypothetical protein